MLIKDTNRKVTKPSCPATEELRHLLNNSGIEVQTEECQGVCVKFHQTDQNNLYFHAKNKEIKVKDFGIENEQRRSLPSVINNTANASEPQVRCSKRKQRLRKFKKGVSAVCWVLFCPLMTCAVCCVLEPPDFSDEDDYTDDPMLCCWYNTNYVPSYKRK